MDTKKLAVALSLSLASLGLACEKEKGKDTTGASGGAAKDPAKDPSQAQKPGAARPKQKDPATTINPGSGVRPPTADDLATYTKGIEGEGTLMAQITTNHGVFHCELFEKEAPMTVANFVGLARGLHPFKDPKTQKVESRPFYDGLIFHRVIPGFMIQGGDPLGKGSGGPGYKFAQEISSTKKHDRPGIMSMANAGPGTNGSQFFITEVPRGHLDGGYNVFGECMEADIVGKIARLPRGRSDRPNESVVMEKVEIMRGDLSKFPKTESSK